MPLNLRELGLEETLECMYLFSLVNLMTSGEWIFSM